MHEHKMNIYDNIEQQLYDQLLLGKSVINIDRITSFYEVIKFLKEKSFDNVTIKCEPYIGDVLFGSNKHTYEIMIKENSIMFYVNGINIDTSESTIVVQNELHFEFIIDIFKLCSNVDNLYETYKCNVHDHNSNNSYESIGYGHECSIRPATIYSRQKKLIKIEDIKSCCNETELISYYDIEKDKYIYNSLGHFVEDHVYNIDDI